MIYGAIDHSRGYGTHAGFDIQAFTVRLPDVEPDSDGYWVSVYVTASKPNKQFWTPDAFGTACEPTVKHTKELSALDNADISSLILEAIDDATGPEPIAA